MRGRLLEGRFEEMKLKRRAERAKTKPPNPDQLLIEEPLNVENPDEFLRIITADTEFRDVLNFFQETIVALMRKRSHHKFVMERTCFEQDYMDRMSYV